MVPSGSGNNGISSFEPVGGESLFESKSTNQISSGNLKPIKIRHLSNNFNINLLTYLKFFLYIRKVAGIPMTNGVGANNNCSAQLIHVGSNGITGNMYSNG